jgi:hypothetical protein
LFPFSLLTLQLLYPFIGWTSLFAAVVLSISEFQLAELNLRYLYPALPFGMIVVAVAYANVRELSRPLFRALCGVGVGVVLLNAYAMPTSGWAHRDFPLWMVLTRGGIEQYRDWGAPERRLIDYLNLTRGRTVRVAFFSRPMLVDLKGDGVFTNWYNYEISTKLEAAGTPAAVFDLMKEQHITHFIAFKPDSGNQNVSGAVEMFLRTYTEPVFSAGDAYLAQLQPEYRFSNETVVNGDFEHGAEGWTQVGVPPANVRPGTVSVSTEGGYRQYISIDDRVVYRYSLTASCDSADTRLRLQILWLDQAGRELGSSLTVQTCGPTRQTFTVDLEPPAGANGGQILLLGLDVNRPAEISKASLKW